MKEYRVEELRKEVDSINLAIGKLLNDRALLVQQIGKLKEKQGIHKFDPEREREMLVRIVNNNNGPLEDEALCYLFKEIFKVSLDLLVDDHKKTLLVSRDNKETNTVIDFGDAKIGDGHVQMIAGPCSVESEEQMSEVAMKLRENRLRFLRGGAFKPRTSPYDFQGLGNSGLEILRRVADRYNLKVISEVTQINDLEAGARYLDVIQIGARNMQNYDLLKAAGSLHVPVLLKRGLASTIEEFIFAAEYIVAEGNTNVILCERGIRTFETWTRNTLDISCIPILKKETHLPVIVDISHATGRRDILLPCARAAIAAGADGIMVEVHPHPEVALSDAKQQIDLATFQQFLNSIHPRELVR